VQDLRERTILVVEDDPTISEILRILLEDTGCRILEASGGVEALRLAAEERPDLITMDLSLPDMDGYDVLRNLQANPELVSVPIVVVSGRQFEQRVPARVVAVLLKPFDASELDDVVRAALLEA
jgi:CheY-like chemotaxis protein